MHTNSPKKHNQNIQKQQSQVNLNLASVRSYQGPIPDSNSVEHYKQIDPQFPEFFMNQAQKEQDHRHKIKELEFAERAQKLNLYYSFKRYGQAFAFVIIILVIILCAFLAYIGDNQLANKILTGISVIIGCTTIFVGINKTRKSNKKNNQTNSLPSEEDLEQQHPDNE